MAKEIIKSGVFSLGELRGAELGAELITNGAFNTDLSGWTAGSDWTWNASSAAASDGGTASGNSLTQTITTVAGQDYEVTATVSAVSGGNPSLTINGTSVAQWFSATPTGSTETATYTATGTSTTLSFTGGNAVWTVDDVSVRAVRSNYDSSTIKRPTRRWGGITGRSLVTSNGTLPKTGVLSLAEMLQASYSRAPASFTFVGASYERSTTNTTTKTFNVPSGAQSGDVLIAISFPSKDTYINTTSTDSLGAAQNEYSSVTELDGWRWQGGTAIGSTGFGDSLCYGRVWDGATSSWTMTWYSSNYSTGVVLAFRPSSPITAWEKTANSRKRSTGQLTGVDANTISAPDTGNADVAVGPRLYVYLLSGTPGSSSVENPTPTFPANEGWVHVDGSGENNGQMDFAYKLDTTGDAFVPTTITTNDAGTQVAHLYCFTMTT